MENLKFMRQPNRKRKARLTAILKEMTELEAEEIRKIVRRLPGNKQLLISSIERDSCFGFKRQGTYTVFYGDGSCMIETENTWVFCLVKSED